MHFGKAIRKVFAALTGLRPAAAHEAFALASDEFDSAFAAVEPYTTCANHRCAIFNAARALENAASGDDNVRTEYEKVVAACTDPADFQAYTADYLSAHTAGMDGLESAFERLTAAFSAIDRGNDLFTSSTNLYRSIVNLYVFAADAYRNAAKCAERSALEGKLQAAKDDFELLLLEARATNEMEPNPSAAAAKAAAFKKTALQKADATVRLEKKAEQALIHSAIIGSAAEAAQAEYCL